MIRQRFALVLLIASTVALLVPVLVRASMGAAWFDSYGDPTIPHPFLSGLWIMATIAIIYPVYMLMVRKVHTRKYNVRAIIIAIALIAIPLILSPWTGSTDPTLAAVSPVLDLIVNAMLQFAVPALAVIIFSIFGLGRTSKLR